MGGYLEGCERGVRGIAGARGLAMVLLALLVCGCVKRLPASAPEVRRIRFDGNAAWFSDRSDANLREAMGHPKPRGVWPFRRKVPLNRRLLEEDEQRLYAYYAHRGYFDAEVERWEVNELRPANDRRPPTVEIRGTVSPDRPSDVAQLRFEGLDGLSADLAAEARRAALLRTGARFTLEDYEGTLAAVRNVLRDRGYPHVTAKGAIDVRRADHEVDVVVTVDPGPRARFGRVKIVGVDKVPRKLVRRRVTVRPRSTYRQRALRETEGNLYELGTFSLVSTRPLLDDDTPEVVGVEVRVDERPPRAISFRSGFGLQAGRQELLAGARFEHLNALRRLVRVNLDVTGGYALLAASLQDLFAGDARGGPVLDARLDLKAPDLPVRRLTTQLSAEFEHEITPAYRTNQPSLTTSLTTRVLGRLQLTLAYRLRLTQYVDLQIDPADLVSLDVAPDLVDGQFFDTHLEQTLVWDTRDDPLAPNKGSRLSLSVREAGTWLGGNYNYVGLRTDLRGYLSLARLGLPLSGTVVAGRLGGGYLTTYGPEDRAIVPSVERLYLGGSGTVRGWAYQRLGPLVCSVEVSDGDVCEETVPVGGRVATWGGLEVRQTWSYYGLAAFVDFGNVWALPEDVRPRVLPTVGLGARYRTPVGPVRLDVAVRTDNLEEYQNEPRFWLHLGLGEAF